MADRDLLSRYRTMACSGSTKAMEIGIILRRFELNCPFSQIFGNIKSTFLLLGVRASWLVIYHDNVQVVSVSVPLARREGGGGGYFSVRWLAAFCWLFFQVVGSCKFLSFSD